MHGLPKKIRKNKVRNKIRNKQIKIGDLGEAGRIERCGEEIRVWIARLGTYSGGSRSGWWICEDEIVEEKS